MPPYDLPGATPIDTTTLYLFLGLGTIALSAVAGWLLFSVPKPRSYKK